MMTAAMVTGARTVIEKIDHQVRLGGHSDRG